MPRRLPLNTKCQILRPRDGCKVMRSQIRGIHDTSASPSLPQDKSPRTSPQAASHAVSNSFLLKSKHGDFGKIQASRPAFRRSLAVEISQTPDPAWQYGKGVNDKSGQHLRHVEIDPYQVGRDMLSNYKLLIAGIPRPISFVSTVSMDGKKNLAPFSYFQVVDHDPPILVIGFSARAGRPKDTRRNLIETGECVISVVSDHMIEAVNATSLDVPHNVSEWGLSGFKAASSSTVKAKRVEDAIFSIEGKLLEMKELDYGHERNGKPHGSLAIIQATRFWVREDALNEAGDDIDLSRMRPLVQLGGIAYGRVRETFELPRPGLEAELENESKGLRPFLNHNVRPLAEDPSGLPHEDPEQPSKAVA